MCVHPVVQAASMSDFGDNEDEVERSASSNVLRRLKPALPTPGFAAGRFKAPKKKRKEKLEEIRCHGLHE